MKNTITLGLLALVTVVGCSDGDSSEEAAADSAQVNTDPAILADDPELLEISEAPDVQAQDPADWEAEIASSWVKDNPTATDEESSCIGKEIVEQIGIERLLDLGVRIESVHEGMVSSAFSDEEVAAIESAKTGCAS